MSIIKRSLSITSYYATARDALSDKERAFVSGTDDYVTKPFEIKELLFRIRAVLRRYQINIQNKIEIGNVSLNDEFMEVSVESKNESSY